MRGVKLGNEYAQQFAHLYEQTPKAVFAAIAFSLAFISEEENAEAAIAKCLREWHALHINGIVPQKPPTMEAK